ncbi:rhomboid family intramembrane serine protease [Mesobacterium pallidum]|uniref:rhomboid family intramembrane serine protease n=1 Tax=Mesobacterium pallidum TaxID=2872037 RepID=UPI001EE179FF|nr:rhomboid family intramembrane serine protease [Mesobacterium pallidum]
MSDPHYEPPVNPIPPVVLALFLVMAAVEGYFGLGRAGLIGGPEAIGWRNLAIQDYAVNGELFDLMLETGRWPPEHVMRLVTYLFVSGSFTQAAFAGAMLLALGKLVGEVFSPLATAAVFLVSGISGALAYGLVLDNTGWLFGAFPGVYGLIGAFTYLLWLKLGELGTNQLRAFTMIGFLMGIQLLFGLLFGGTRDWVADVGGFGAGFLMSFVISPGGWSRLRDRMRQR